MKTTSRILRAKLRPPRLGPDRLERPRLLAQLDRGLLGQCILVCAAAGYGKTTLLSQWIERSEMPSGWLSLDEGDDEPALFLEELVATLRMANPGCCQRHPHDAGPSGATPDRRADPAAGERPGRPR